MTILDEQILNDLPDPESARRFIERFAERHPNDFKKLTANRSLLSDILTIVSFSDYLSATLLENPPYLAWLDKRRRDSGVRSKEELVESLAQFRLTNGTLEPTALYEKFCRRELLRIFLRDIRRLATIAEITEEISNLADAILESAVREASTEVDNRYGKPQEEDAKGKGRFASFCIVALGKLGSRELNYSSDIDLLFLYSGEGKTRGGTKESVTNREYFVKLAELVVKLIGQNPQGPSAYRVDLRLRPHGSLGALAMSLGDTITYFEKEARAWERQVLIRSRAAAGDGNLFADFFRAVDGLVFDEGLTPEKALANIREAKNKIDAKQKNGSPQDVKLGPGGIREIEFLAQGLQLAHGGRDKWLRSPHTLISLARLAEHGFINARELSALSSAYDFLRRTEHIIQMENGLQTHALPAAPDKLSVLAKRMSFAGYKDFKKNLRLHTENVREIFERVTNIPEGEGESLKSSDNTAEPPEDVPNTVQAVSALHKSDRGPQQKTPVSFENFSDRLKTAKKYSEQLSLLRILKTEELSKIRESDLAGRISMSESKAQQTQLAEACIFSAVDIAKRHLGTVTEICVLALGKLGSRTLDYGSDLDLIIVYDADAAGESLAKHTRVVETFVNVLSAMTRDGSLYRVDLRLRPHGSKGMIATGSDAFLNYLKEEAAIWELLALVKLRGVGAENSNAKRVDLNAREIIHQRARELSHEELKQETRRIRIALETSRASPRRDTEIDIKYGAGGMLDIYFTTRYLQLRDDVRDDEGGRSTARTLEKLRERGSLSPEQFEALSAGYTFLSQLDHALRLTVGRTNKIPIGNNAAIAKIHRLVDLKTSRELNETLTLHRLQVREVFDEVLSVA